MNNQNSQSGSAAPKVRTPVNELRSIVAAKSETESDLAVINHELRELLGGKSLEELNASNPKQIERIATDLSRIEGVRRIKAAINRDLVARGTEIATAVAEEVLGMASAIGELHTENLNRVRLLCEAQVRAAGTATPETLKHAATLTPLWIEEVRFQASHSGGYGGFSWELWRQEDGTMVNRLSEPNFAAILAAYDRSAEVLEAVRLHAEALRQRKV